VEESRECGCVTRDVGGDSTYGIVVLVTWTRKHALYREKPCPERAMSHPPMITSTTIPVMMVITVRMPCIKKSGGMNQT
jgi:hypothetical protein